MDITSVRVQSACITHRQIVNAIETGTGSVQQHIEAWARFDKIVDGFDSDDVNQWAEYRAYRDVLYNTREWA
jgi:hypothetical protein